MSSGYFKKTMNGRLEACDEAGMKALAALPIGYVVRVEIRRPRNPQWHRKYWAALNLIFNNQSRYKTIDHLHVAVKIMLGHSDLITLKDGREVYVPRSESFAKMTQDEFEAYWQRFCDLVTTQLIPGLKRADLEKELFELVA